MFIDGWCNGWCHCHMVVNLRTDTPHKGMAAYHMTLGQRSPKVTCPTWTCTYSKPLNPNKLQEACSMPCWPFPISLAGETKGTSTCTLSTVVCMWHNTGFKGSCTLTTNRVCQKLVKSQQLHVCVRLWVSPSVPTLLPRPSHIGLWVGPGKRLHHSGMELRPTGSYV